MMARFPDGRFGIGLLVLRNILAAMVWSLGADQWGLGAYVLVGVPAIVCLCLGLLTPWVAPLGGVITVVEAAAFHGVSFEYGAQTIAVAVSVALLGPGAYSVDSRLIGGRRRILG